MILTTENYFSTEAQMEYMSYSQYKDFLDCEYKALERAKGNYKEPQTYSFLLGSYIDAHFECRLGIFKAQNPGYKRIQDKANEIIKRVERDPVFMKYMNGQKQVIMTGEIAGVPIKIKIDVFHPGKAIVDFKSTKDFNCMYKPAEGRLNFIEYWGYDIQGCIYQEIVNQKYGERLPFIIAAATKEKVADIGLFSLPQSVLDAQMSNFVVNAPRFQAIKQGLIEPERCEHCDLCNYTKVLKGITSWEELNEYGT